MSIVVCNAGEIFLLEAAMKTSSPENLVLKLFANDYTPIPTSTAGSFTEASFSGYSAASLSRSSWTSASTNGSGKAEISYPVQTFSATSSQTIFGYYVVGATSGNLVYAERFGSPRSLISGDTLNVSPKMTLSSES